jgi:hypothetical protein
MSHSPNRPEGLHESQGFRLKVFPCQGSPVARSRRKTRILCVCLKVFGLRRPSRVTWSRYQATWRIRAVRPAMWATVWW